MVAGLRIFSEHFKGMESRFVIIGGTACDLWLGKEVFKFRETKDIDMVLVVEALDTAFIGHFWSFVKAGRYSAFRQDSEKPKFYRFERPKTLGYPKMIELLTRNYLGVPDGIQLTPVPLDSEISSLSAILLDEEYYRFVVSSRLLLDNLPIISPKCLIPLKARAYLDLKKRKEAGAQNVKGTDVKKHRNDVFRLYLSLKPEDSFDLPEVLKNDLREFLSAFSSGNTEWEDIGKSLGKNLLGSPETAIRNLKGIFKL